MRNHHLAAFLRGNEELGFCGDAMARETWRVLDSKRFWLRENYWIFNEMRSFVPCNHGPHLLIYMWEV